jgi:hypothetical protein
MGKGEVLSKHQFSLDDLYELVYPDDRKVNGYMCMIYHSFLDDSHDRGAKRVMVSAGFCGTRDRWAAFRTDWRQKLKEHRLCYFKSSECHSVSGQFTKLRKSGKSYPTTEERSRARKIRSEFLGVIRAHPFIRAIGVAVQLEEYRRYAALPEVKGMIPDNPYKAALSSVMFETVGFVRRASKNNMVTFVHDEGDDFPELWKCYSAFKELNKKTARFIDGFQSLDDKKTPELQAADLISNHATYLAEKKLDLRDAVVEMRENISLLGIWDEDYLRRGVRGTLLRNGMPLPLELEEEPPPMRAVRRNGFRE